MIIDHVKKYIFIGLPFSASSAISKELIEQYGGKPLLSKHANIPSLLKERPDININDYYIFAVARDPVDFCFTLYNKYLTNPYETYTDPKHFIENGGFVSKSARKTYHKTQEKKWSFEEFLKNKYRFHPYDSDLSINKPYINGIIRFSHLSEDFKKCLQEIGIEPVRDLPLYNKTTKLAKENTISENMKRKIFGPYYWYNKQFYTASYQINILEKVYFRIFQFLRFYKRLRFDSIQNKKGFYSTQDKLINQ